MKVPSGVPTDELRSGDRLIPTVMISGLSLKTISEFTDPFVVAFMKYLELNTMIRFESPEAWKDSIVTLGIVLGTGLAAWFHMNVIRKADANNSDNPNEEVNPNG